MADVKRQLREIADQLPDDATWEQVRYAVHVREQIEAGESAIRDGRTVAHDEVKRRFSEKC